MTWSISFTIVIKVLSSIDFFWGKFLMIYIKFVSVNHGNIQLSLVHIIDLLIRLKLTVPFVYYRWIFFIKKKIPSPNYETILLYKDAIEVCYLCVMIVMYLWFMVAAIGNVTLYQKFRRHKNRINSICRICYYCDFKTSYNYNSIP